MTSASVVEAVIFDFGGVITSSPFEAFNRLEAERGLPRDFVRRINATNPDSNAWAQFERSEIDAATFDRLFAEEARALGHELDGASVLAVLAGAVRPAMVGALDRLAGAGFRLGCITNNVPAGHGAGMARSADAHDTLEQIFARFEHVIESSKAGVRKPDPRIYLMMCEALGLAPAQCVYLDDLGINCKPAAALGMHAIKVTSGEQALADLGAVLGLDLLAPG
ncbi:MULTISPECIES: HAD-IA family hydrolase [Novosphingobium]|uniref:HAD-IA family hydrolase n=1 Tax=Novosphingobium TaxID=165696 RepID=UPI000D6DF83B|nr:MULTISPECIES: HAD-IA family hydrolase [Novosphingobium]